MTNNKFFTYNGKCSSVVIFSVLQYNCFFVAHNRDANSNLPSVYISVANTPWRKGGGQLSHNLDCPKEVSAWEKPSAVKT